MKGVILAGGTGSRLHPLTLVTNKSLLPVYDEPMIYYPIRTLVEAGITEILLVCGGNASGEFLRILGNGEQFGLNRLHYAYQDGPKGIAHALGLAREFAGSDPICVVLGDNIFQDYILGYVEDFRDEPEGACIFATRVDRPEHYGVIETEGAKVVRIVEKPKEPKSDRIATGLYMYDSTLWGFIDSLSPSARGELEITDVNNYYITEGRMRVVDLAGEWHDCGENVDGYLSACNSAARWKSAE